MAHTSFIPGHAGEYDRALNPSADLLASRRLLELVAAQPELGTVIRLYSPAPTVAFSGREAAMPAFAEAVAESITFGFEPVIRPAGGRMVALDENWLVLDIIRPEIGRSIAHKDMFLHYGDVFVELLTNLGIEAGIGSVEGEYCPGDYSVNARQQVKLIGTAQRVTRGARLFSASIPFQISPSVTELFSRINGLLGLDWEPETLGSIRQEAPRISRAQLEGAVKSAFAVDAHQPSELADFFHIPALDVALSR